MCISKYYNYKTKNDITNVDRIINTYMIAYCFLA